MTESAGGMSFVKPLIDIGKGFLERRREAERRRIEEDNRRHQEFLTRFGKKVEEGDAQQQKLRDSIDKLDGFRDVTRNMTRTREKITELGELRRQQLEKVWSDRDRIEQGLEKADAVLSQRPTPPPMPGKC